MCGDVAREEGVQPFRGTMRWALYNPMHLAGERAGRISRAMANCDIIMLPGVARKKGRYEGGYIVSKKVRHTMYTWPWEAGAKHGNNQLAPLSHTARRHAYIDGTVHRPCT